MANIFFVFKIFLISCVLLFIMQIRIGSLTIEEHSIFFARNSQLTRNLQEVAHGAIVAVKDSIKVMTGSLKNPFTTKKVDETLPGYRKWNLLPERSQEAIEKTSKK